MQKVFLGIGGNVGNKQKNFKQVLLLVEKHFGKVINTSSIYETPPWGFDSPEKFWNQVILIETNLTARDLLSRIHETEQLFGRKRSAGIRYSSREMDIDILYFGNECMDDSILTVPHPHIGERKFVLIPLVEIAPGFIHPRLGLCNLQLLENCRDDSPITKIVLP